MNKYLEKFNRKLSKINIDPLEEYARKHHIPIIEYDSLMIILSLIRAKKVSKLLEIGTAIGYSAIQMASCFEKLNIDTIERDQFMYDEALKNIRLYQLDKRIKPHFADALNIDLNCLDKSYDMLFIDAAKSQSEKFFKRFLPLLKEDAIIITDNILFHGCIENRENLSKNVRKMVEKIDNYNNFLSSLNDFETIFINVGDGLALTMRKNK